ncbi:16S rRNA (cytidine(1402)-2'-O)-methyltransferase [Candidatus Peregrinibacteria bacterium]|nr:16S rRNA (cytidine(1402)-2'-O)-methyltransferase [Candidatus Peregrinibacteria bacterium]MBI3816285.1 16S rRNA (cytidine(1402)-2'-O)-methyltransferase [Candidatus Peregrinibacteria bacterium]
MLSIVATPIGNLGDITLRAIETFKHCSAVVCEDTRVTGNLLKQLEIPKKELISLHGYSDPQKIERILERLRRGEHLALVSDAGTPGISDPGYALVAKARESKLVIEAIPGPSAFLAALSVSGLPIQHFTYLGFLPLKKGRKTMLESFKTREETIVFYESVHRITRTLEELATVFHDQPNRPIVIARELTKLHEEVIVTTVGELSMIAKKLTLRGEFVIVIGGAQ